MKSVIYFLITLFIFTLTSCAQDKKAKIKPKLTQEEISANLKRNTEKNRAELAKKFGGPIKSYVKDGSNPIRYVTNTGNFNIKVTPYNKTEEIYNTVASNCYTTTLIEDNFTIIKIYDTVQKIRLVLLISAKTSGTYPIASPEAYYPQNHPNHASVLFYFKDDNYNFYSPGTGSVTINIVGDKISGTFICNRNFSHTSTGSFNDISY